MVQRRVSLDVDDFVLFFPANGFGAPFKTIFPQYDDKNDVHQSSHTRTAYVYKTNPVVRELQFLQADGYFGNMQLKQTSTSTERSNWFDVSTLAYSYLCKLVQMHRASVENKS